MCPSCDGLGERYTLVTDLLIPDPSKSIQAGAVILLGKSTQWTRATRQQMKGVAAALEKGLDLPKDSLLKTPWKKLSDEARHYWLHGTGDDRITFTRRGGKNPKLFRGSFPGLLEKLLSEWNNSKSPILRRHYEKYMQTLPCTECQGQRLNPQARHVRLASTHPRWKQEPWLSLPEVSAMPLGHCLEFFQTLELSELQQHIAVEALKEVTSRLGFLLEVGLSYLCLARTAPTLSGVSRNGSGWRVKSVLVW